MITAPFFKKNYCDRGILSQDIENKLKLTTTTRKILDLKKNALTVGSRSSLPLILLSTLRIACIWYVS